MVSSASPKGQALSRLVNDRLSSTACERAAADSSDARVYVYTLVTTNDASILMKTSA
jgi:hypothetical protein